MPIERRDNFRVPIPRSQATTLLRDGVRQFSVYVLDISAEGFAVVCPETCEVNRGHVLKIRSTDGWYKARVSRIGPIEKGKFPSQYNCVLGLDRLDYLGYGPDGRWFAGRWLTAWLASAAGSRVLASWPTFRLTIRDVLWLTMVVAMGFGWWIDHGRGSEAKWKVKELTLLLRGDGWSVRENRGELQLDRTGPPGSVGSTKLKHVNREWELPID